MAEMLIDNKRIHAFLAETKGIKNNLRRIIWLKLMNKIFMTRSFLCLRE